MSYRDESDSLRARVEQLEGKLAQASATIARLEGATPSAGVGREAKESRVLGAPSALLLERTLPFEIDEGGYEAIAETVRTRIGAQVSQVGHALTTRGDTFSLRREAGTTRVRLHGDWSVLVVPVIALPGVAAFLGGLPMLGVLLDVSANGSPNAALHALWMIPSLIAASAYFGRSGAKSLAKKALRKHESVFETVLALAEKHAVRAPGAQVRVDVDEIDDAALENENVARARRR